MPFPNFEYCIICDAIRPELGNKLSLLGFFGLAPNVEIAFGDPNQRIALSLLSGFPPVQDATRPYSYVVVISRPDGSIAFQAPPVQLRVSPNGRVMVGAAVTLHRRMCQVGIPFDLW